MVFMTEDVLQITGGKLLRGRQGLGFSEVSTDSRTIGKGGLFVAICGERYDGHDFTGEVLKKGANGVVVRQGWQPPGPDSGGERNVIAVPNTLRALQNLARSYRMRFAIPVAAVTGTNGKTSTKEMIYSILSLERKVFRSPGNLNNHIGVPLSLFGMDRETEAAVLEFGMSGFGEIRRLREIARPTIVVITNVSRAHLMTLKSLEDVARAKAEILEEMPEQGWAVLNRDDARVSAMAPHVGGKVITFGLSEDADLTAQGVTLSEAGSRFLLRHGAEAVAVELPAPGLHHVSNALAAAAAARVLGTPLSIIARGLGAFVPLGMRWETSTLPDGAVIINDAYNANPASMKAAIRTVERLGAGRRNIAVFGDMRELAEFSEEAHREIGRLVAAGPFEILLTVGVEAERIADEAEKQGMDPARIRRFGDWEDAARTLREMLTRDDRVLLKASRAVGLERIVKALGASGP